MPSTKSTARAGLPISRAGIEEFVAHQLEKGGSATSAAKYEHDLLLFYQWLPPDDKAIHEGDLEAWSRAQTAAGYAARTVNSRISAANAYLNYNRRRDLQCSSFLQTQPVTQELTRAEYLRLLQTARARGKRQQYLLIKVFANLGLQLRDLPKVTVAAVERGSVETSAGPVTIPSGLRRELQEYIRLNSLAFGPVFCTDEGRPLNRSVVTVAIGSLCRAAQVDPEKGNPRCLRKLYQQTQAELHASAMRIVQSTYDQLLETEQMVVGWDDPEPEVSGF